MKPLALLIVVGGLAIASVARVTAQQPQIRTDGVYQEDPPRIDKRDHAHRRYLRFYADGFVIRKDTIDDVTLATFLKGFVPGGKYVEAGSYSIRGTAVNVSFDLGPNLLGSGRLSARGEGDLRSDGTLRLTQHSTAGGATVDHDPVSFRFLADSGR